MKYLFAVIILVIGIIVGIVIEQTKPSPIENPITPQQPSQADGCYVGGCSSQICSDEPGGGMSTCEWREVYACYKTATCERQNNGQCGWTVTAELAACIATGNRL